MSKEPMDVIRVNLDERVYLKCKGGREIVGQLHAYDEHCNMLLSDAIETFTSVELDPTTNQEVTTITSKDSGVVFVRGDALILLSHANST
ncbi:putative U6 snRNA-associated Sm-like protein LSm3 [Babesia bovis T2Bo]|uniref:LSM domain containing protein n=1 Tax=Babesia bovis TaxID=5865 RepID=A7APW1_BABBO|nr:putative U6 snRNA-associated Sm-like protein LSm3 [Babesia bovis T2Bo]EDO08594.1 putative U6 snRNA-associated Sm-like protein LSm3 [Babesia bovis T2Bo]|eukprot:XP_001612162.1 LSM domain containing protein [Babesia bovis T2Bo]